jgi:hypothetical protein
MSPTDDPSGSAAGVPGRASRAFDERDQRYHLAAGLRKQLNKVVRGTGRSCSGRSRSTASSCCCACRKPREANWVIGVLLLFVGFLAGFVGYSLPDDLLGGIGLRIASGFLLSIPVAGTWAHWALFGGEFPAPRSSRCSTSSTSCSSPANVREL